MEARRGEDGMKLVAAVESLRLELGWACLDANGWKVDQGLKWILVAVGLRIS